MSPEEWLEKCGKSPRISRVYQRIKETKPKIDRAAKQASRFKGFLSIYCRGKHNFIAEQYYDDLDHLAYLLADQDFDRLRTGFFETLLHDDLGTIIFDDLTRLYPSKFPSYIAKG